ncbi:MAG: ferrochelatase [Proteobacteria bacterium]|nr:ferrochelatase [Pseudomonadota bacterium]
MTRKAVVLFNLGGPDGPEAVEPFLFNLFNDAAIIRLPGPLRWAIAKLISRRRAPVAQEIYSYIGGSSPLLPQTLAQADALKQVLSNKDPDTIYEVFTCMRYWHPRADQVVREVQKFSPDEVLLLPLYPQFSSTTTASSLKDWHAAAAKIGLTVPTASLCCYPAETGLAKAYARLAAPLLEGFDEKPVRFLLSAHGLPQKIVDAGDPYQWQIEKTAAAIVASLPKAPKDWKVCYQSRVGPMKWLQPSTEDEIQAAGEEGTSLVILPIAFVSEHSETLVELDIEYAELAKEAGVPDYRRVPTVGVAEEFIDGLASLLLKLETGQVMSSDGGRICPADFKDCALVAS